MKNEELRALIIEDDPSWQTILREILSDFGLTVDVAGTLDEAVQLLRTHAHRIALVDLSLKASDHRNQDGLKALDMIRQYDPGCIPILLTGHATVEIAVSALTEHHAYTCLRKETFTRSVFKGLLQQALSSPAPHLESGFTTETQFTGTSRTARTESAPSSPVASALVVEDDAGWRSVLTELLTEAGYQVRLCSSFAEAIGSLGRDRFDLAVIDLSLSASPRPVNPSNPDANRQLEGFRLLVSMRTANIPTIVVTGMVSTKEIETIYAEYGVRYCLQKQAFDRQAFRRAITEIRTTERVDPMLEQLTEREMQVLTLLAQGLTNKEIAESLVISTNTVKRHLKAIFAKLGTHTRAATATKAISAGVQSAWSRPIPAE